MQAPTSSHSDCWEEIDKLMASRIGPTGPGWFGVEEFASRYGLTVGKARVIVEGLHREGKLDFWSGITGTPARKRNLYRYKKAVDSSEPVAIVPEQ